MSIKAIATSIWKDDNVRRIVHTFWQAAAGALIAGLTVAQSTSDVKLTVATAVAVGLAAVKGLVLSWLNARG